MLFVVLSVVCYVVVFLFCWFVVVWIVGCSLFWLLVVVVQILINPKAHKQEGIFRLSPSAIELNMFYQSMMHESGIVVCVCYVCACCLLFVVCAVWVHLYVLFIVLF